MQAIVHSNIFLLALTLAVYYAASLLYKRFPFPLLNPLVVSVVVIVVLLRLLGVGYAEYYQANSIINFMLGVSVVALGYLLEQNITHISGNVLSILTAVFLGSLLAVGSVWGIAWWMGADELIIDSLKPKTVTMPIAVAIAENSGGLPALASLAVILAGVSGSVMGPWLLKIAGVRDGVSRGLALGSASHAVGTAKAMELGAIEGAVGGAAIGLMGLMTALLIPVLERLF